MSATPSPARFANGRLTLHEPIGTGGMASVYVGRWRDGDAVRTVAVKRPHPHLLSAPAFLAMFLDEARLTLRLRHPNIVQTLEVVVEASNVLLVMDHVHGVALSALLEMDGIREVGVPLNIAVAIVLDVAHALQAAHDAVDDEGAPLGIVHRDVSPHNVIVGADGAARLLDFGIAKAANRLQTTDSGQLKGKLQYMSPEALDGHPIDRRADVYALAAVLWGMLAGCPLITSDSHGGAVRQILLEPFDPPSARAPSTPRQVDSVIGRALSRSPALRHASAREFAEDLARAAAPASRSEVAAWLATVGGRELRARAELVARAEADGALAPSGDRYDDLTDVNAALDARAATPGAPVRRPIKAVAGVAVVLVLALVAVVASSSRRDSSPRSPKPLTLSADFADAGSRPSAASPLPSSSDDGSAASITPSPNPVPPRVPAASSARPKDSLRSRKPRPSCNPPTVIDTRGIAHFKPGCLAE